MFGEQSQTNQCYVRVQSLALIFRKYDRTDQVLKLLVFLMNHQTEHKILITILGFNLRANFIFIKLELFVCFAYYHKILLNYTVKIGYNELCGIIKNCSLITMNLYVVN
jgi:hypothetical protein